MNKIFEALDSADRRPISQATGDSTVLTAEPDRGSNRKITQITSSGIAVADDEPLAVTTAGPTPAFEMDPSTRQELIRLTHTLFLSSGDTRVVAFSGVEAGAGCSWMLVRIAELLAGADAGSVCVVDADFNDPTLHSYFGASNKWGLSDALVGSQPIPECVRRFGQRLYLLSSGSIGPKAEILLASSAFRLRIEELRAFFDFVLIDTPPLAASSDALMVASRTDGLAMVVEADSTNRETALKAARHAAAANVRMLGVVLNKRTYPIPEAIYKKL